MQMHDEGGLLLSFRTVISRNGLDSAKTDGAPSWRCPSDYEAGVDFRLCLGSGLGTRPL